MEKISKDRKRGRGMGGVEERKRERENLTPQLKSSVKHMKSEREVPLNSNLNLKQKPYRVH
jgi:hypothetical protein